MRSLAFSCLFLSLVLGCVEPNPGDPPNIEQSYFPLGLSYSKDAKRLYVLSSDYDLQFTSGNLQVIDVERLAKMLPVACASDADCAPKNQICDNKLIPVDGGSSPTNWCVDPITMDPCPYSAKITAAERAYAPGRCEYIDWGTTIDGQPIQIDAVHIGAFGTNIMYRKAPDGSGRVFIPVRGNSSIYWADVEKDLIGDGSGPVLDCGQGSTLDCDANHQRGTSASQAGARDLVLSTEPYGIDADVDGKSILIAHQVDGVASLFINSWEGGASGGPRLEDALTSDLPDALIGVAAIPPPIAIKYLEKKEEYVPGYLVTSASEATLSLIRYYSEELVGSAGARISLAETEPIRANGNGVISRDIAIGTWERDACEANCNGAMECEKLCSGIPLEVFVANRSPPSLLIGLTDRASNALGTSEMPTFTDVVSLFTGPSRVLAGEVIGRDGKPEPRVFVLSYDAARLTIFNPATRTVELEVETGRGPGAITLDLEHGVAFVAAFTDSFVAVLDIDRRHSTYGEYIMTIGKPVPPRGTE